MNEATMLSEWLVRAEKEIDEELSTAWKKDRPNVRYPAGRTVIELLYAIAFRRGVDAGTMIMERKQKEILRSLIAESRNERNGNET